MVEQTSKNKLAQQEAILRNVTCSTLLGPADTQEGPTSNTTNKADTIYCCSCCTLKGASGTAALQSCSDMPTFSRGNQDHFPEVTALKQLQSHFLRSTMEALAFGAEGLCMGGGSPVLPLLYYTPQLGTQELVPS